MKRIFRLLSKLTSLRAASRGPGAYARHRARKGAHRGLGRLLRRLGL